MKEINSFHNFCDIKSHYNEFMSICSEAATKGYTTKKFIENVLEASYYRSWHNIDQFLGFLKETLSIINETSADNVRQALSPEAKEQRYGNIIKAVKASFEKLLDKMHYKAAIDLDAFGETLEPMKKRQVINLLYKKIVKTVTDFDPEIVKADPQQLDRLRQEVKKVQQDFESAIMPYINQFLKTNIDPKYDSYDVIMAKIQGSRELGIRKLGGVAKNALSRKIYELLRKEGIEPVYKRKIELLARAIGAEPPSLEQIKTQNREKQTRLSAEAEARNIDSARRTAEMDAARARGDLRYNPDLDKALGLG